MKSWSNYWKSSRNPGKQRKYRLNAPLHIKRKMCSSHISRELKQKYSTRSMPVILGDKVKVVRGQFKNRTGKVEKIDLKKNRIIVSGIEIEKKDGSKTKYPINSSNLVITELNLEDKKRNAILERKKKK
ncbi:50S ribosomal protein L24 [Candidatus Woesearchaeota archaeon]|nr:50S ribosomal protein L24 [Candidatus Woesearchaeota archaeon]